MIENLAINSIPAVLPVLPVAQSLLLILAVFGIAVLGALSIILKPQTWKQCSLFLWRQKIGLVSLGLFMILAIGAAKSAKLLYRLPQTDFKATVDSGNRAQLIWQHRGGLSRTGNFNNSLGPETGGQVWAASQNFQFFSSPAMTHDSVLNLGHQWNQSRFMSWDRSTGALNWSVGLSGFRQALSSPILIENMLICGEGVHSTTDARVVCLDMNPGREGKLLWSWKTSGHVECTPVVDQGKVYFNAGDDGVYCLALDPQVPDDQRLIWHIPGSVATDAETCLAVHDDHVYVGLGENGNALCVYDAQTGTEQHRIETKYPVFGLPAIVENKIAFGTGKGNLLESGSESAGEVICLDINTLKTLWTFETPDAVMGAVAATENHFVFGSADGTLFQLSHQGKELSRWFSSARYVTSPAIAENGIYIVTGDGLLTGLSHKTFAPFWQSRIGAPGLYVSSPVIADGHIYVGTPENGFVCVGRPELSSTSDKFFSVGTTGIAWSDRSQIPSQGNKLWSIENFSDAKLHSNVALLGVSNSEIILQSVTGHRSTLVCLENNLNRLPTVRWKLPLSMHPKASVVFSQTQLYVTSKTETESFELTAIDLKSGIVSWHRDLNDDPPSGLSIVQDKLLFNDSDQQLICLTLDNQLNWKRSTGAMTESFCLEQSILVGTTSSPCELFALDFETGRKLWSVPLKSPATAGPYIKRNRIIIPTGMGVEVHSLLDGAELTHQTTRQPVMTGTAVSVDTKGLRYLSSSNQFVESTFQTRKNMANRIAGIQAKQILSGQRAILVHDESQLYRKVHSLDRIDWKVWNQDDLDGTISGPIVLQGGRIYFLTQKGVLHCFGAMNGI